MKKNHKRNIEIISSVAAVIILYVVMQLFGITCPIKYITGISCAGCGMTRAWIALFHFDIKGAFYYHPLFMLPPLFVILILFKNKLNKKVYKTVIFTMIILFVIIYLFRLTSGDNDIVTFRPQDGIIWKLVNNILG